MTRSNRWNICRIQGDQSNSNRFMLIDGDYWFLAPKCNLSRDFIRTIQPMYSIMSIKSIIQCPIIDITDYFGIIYRLYRLFALEIYITDYCNIVYRLYRLIQEQYRYNRFVRKCISIKSIVLGSNIGYIDYYEANNRFNRLF